MAVDKDLEQALEALARPEGKSAGDLLGEMLGDRAKKALGDSTEITRSSKSERDAAIERHNAEEFPGTPVVRYQRDPYNETPDEARERWLEEEAELLDGVHGLGGQSAGGIFGDGAIATSIYDPNAEGRAISRAGSATMSRISRVLERLEGRLEAAEGRALPGPARRRLTRGNR